VDRAERDNVTGLVGLSEAELEDQERDADEDESHEVGNEEGTTAKLVHEVGKPPHIAETNSTAHTGQDEGSAALPARAFFAVASHFLVSRWIRTLVDSLVARKISQRFVHVLQRL
jgi:hypothetical protein